MQKVYIGVDISKKTLDLAMTRDGETIDGILHTTNSEEGFKKIKSWISINSPGHQVHVCMEATGKYGERVEEFFHKMESCSVSVCNPFRISSFARSQLSRTKTDKSDAKLIACYLVRMKPAVTRPVSEIVKKIKEKRRFMLSLKQEIVQEKGRLDHYSDSTVCAMIHETIKQLGIQVQKLSKEILDLKDADEEFRKNYTLLISIPAISSQTALTLLTEMIPQSPGVISRKVQTAHAGLAPSIKQSGTSVFSCKLTPYASHHLKNALYFPTLSAIRYNPMIAAFYLKLIQSGKPKMVAVVACMRKLLHIAIGILNNQVPFDPSFRSAYSLVLK